MNSPGIVATWIGLAPRLQSILRILAAFMFMTAGTSKMFAFPAGIPPDGGTVELVSQLGLGGFLEVTCGILLLLGLFTRSAAFLMSGQMAVAYFQFHLPGGFWPTINGGVPAVLYCFLWLYYSAAGPGPWSLDAIRRKSAV
jgi:putative oxidoreductase